jgi:hypothetical protein
MTPWVWQDDEPNPALVPDEPQPEEREYEVVGETNVLGHDPGEKFKATLPFEQEKDLLYGGHLKQVPPTKKAPAKAKKE